MLADTFCKGISTEIDFNLCLVRISYILATFHEYKNRRHVYEKRPFRHPANQPVLAVVKVELKPCWGPENEYKKLVALMKVLGS